MTARVWSSVSLGGFVLRDTDLHRADVRGANLRSADLRNTILRGAILQGARLENAQLVGGRANIADVWLAFANIDSTPWEMTH